MARRDGAARTQAEEQTMTTPAVQEPAPADTAPSAPIAHSLSLVLPAHNEAGNLEWVVREALAVLPNRKSVV